MATKKTRFFRLAALSVQLLFLTQACVCTTDQQHLIAAVAAFQPQQRRESGPSSTRKRTTFRHRAIVSRTNWSGKRGTASSSLLAAATTEESSPSSSTASTVSSSSPSSSPSSSTSKTTIQQPVTTRSSRIGSLMDWCKNDNIGIQIASSMMKLQDDDTGTGGLGWFCCTSGEDATSSSRLLDDGSLLMTVPSKVALTVESPGSGIDDDSIISALASAAVTSCSSTGDSGSIDEDAIKQKRKQIRSILDGMPWYVQMAMYLHTLDKIDSTSKNKKDDSSTTDFRPWLDALPRTFDTPIHWNDDDDDKLIHDDGLLQYPYMTDAVQRQKESWNKYYQTIINKNTGIIGSELLSWNDFLWGCECARSRSFGSKFTGGSLDVRVFAFTLILITITVSLGINSLEQAANGAGLVFCLSIFKDFIIPKLLYRNNKRYVLCPMIDMANHISTKPPPPAEVSFEYFGNAYSLAVSKSSSSSRQEGGEGGQQGRTSIKSGDEICISYGDRSNDQLLQYYGFCIQDNPHDVYVMKPIGEWDIEALERAVGRTFSPGRLQKLQRAGLLGTSSTSSSRLSNSKDESDNKNDYDDLEFVGNPRGGVILTRCGENGIGNGIDPAALQGIRALVSTDDEWMMAGEAIGNFVNPISIENEGCAKKVAYTAIEMEYNSKVTTLEDDMKQYETIMKKKNNKNNDDMYTITTTQERHELLALQFRIEKKKILKETLERLKQQND